MSQQPLVIYGELLPHGVVVVCDGAEGGLAAIYPDYPFNGSPATRLAARQRIADRVAADARIDAICEAEVDPVRRWRLTDQPVAVRRLLERPAGMGAIAGVPSAYGPTQPRLVLASHLVGLKPSPSRENIFLVDGSTASTLLGAMVELRLLRTETLETTAVAR